MNNKIKTIVNIAIMTSIICICSMITIPFTIPFTLQTFAIFLSILYLGGKKSFISISLYLILGIIGLPVFSSFGSGLGVILGPTGGYLIGFLLMPLIYLIFVHNDNKTYMYKTVILILSLLMCYLIGSIWYYIYNDFSINFITIIKVCVLPFIIFDLAKLLISIFIDNRMKHIIDKK